MQAEQKNKDWQAGTLRTALSLGAVLLLVHLAQGKDVFSDFTRPTVIIALHLLGIQAADHGGTIAVGRLEVPWTRDCAGLSLLFVLLAITIWVHRSEKLTWKFLLRLAWTVPAAVLANVARVLTLIGYREWLYPQVESPQLHYFFGLVWLLPFVALFVPKSGRPMGHVVIEALHAASVLALLAPMSGTPGGDAVTIAAMMCLGHCRLESQYGQTRRWLVLAWLALAAAICLIGMESFWLPWLLICPLLVSKKWITSPWSLALIAGTHPLFGMIPGGAYILWGLVAVVTLQWFGVSVTPQRSADPGPVFTPRWHIPAWAAAACFVLPFVASTAFCRVHKALHPPTSLHCEAIACDGFEIQLPEQSEQIGLIWYNPSGNGRHHSMKVCLKYRGVELEPVGGCPSVFTDQEHWMREFYLQGGQLLSSYPDYIRQTFRPWASPGVHLIFVTNMKSMSAGSFNEVCVKLSQRLYERCQAENTLP